MPCRRQVCTALRLTPTLDLYSKRLHRESVNWKHRVSCRLQTLEMERLAQEPIFEPAVGSGIYPSKVTLPQGFQMLEFTHTP